MDEAHGPPFDAPVASNAARDRVQELDTLRRLARSLADALQERDVLERAVTVLAGPGPFACAEALLRASEEAGFVRASAAGRTAGSACERPSSADLHALADAAVAGGVPCALAGWTVVPLGDRALIAVAGGGEASEAFLGAAQDLILAALKRARLHRRLAEREMQRSRLLQAVLTAQEEERGRISRDLHDQIGQALTALVLGLDKHLDGPRKRGEDAAGSGSDGAVADAAGGGSVDDLVDLHRLKELALTTLGDVRRIALDLRPSVLDELGLEAAIRRHAREVRDRFGIDVSVLVRLPRRLSRQEETVLYRVAQESLTNVVRHAKARTASVVVTMADGYVQMVVEDDGEGFDPAALVPAEQVGLVGMRQRLEFLGGSLRVESAPGRGTTVHGRVPVG